MVLAEVIKEGIWLLFMCEELGFKIDLFKLNCDL